MNNDHEAWLSQLSDAYGRMVFTTAYRVLGNVDDAEDALQEVFLKLLGARKEHGKTDGVREWGAYLRVMATRTAVNLLRKRRRHERDGRELSMEIETVAKSNPRSDAIGSQKAMLLRQALRELSTRDARIFALHYFEEFPYEAIAREMKLSVNQVGVILHRARRRLREILEPVLKPLASPAPRPASEPRLCSEKGK